MVSSGRVADILLASLVLEAAALLAWHRRTGRGPAPLDILAILLPGVFLALALRFALTDARWEMVPLALTGALGAHLFDVWRRFKPGR